VLPTPDAIQLPPTVTIDHSVSKYQGHWMGAGVVIRKVWKDISIWGASGPSFKVVFRIDNPVGNPYEKFGILITSALLYSYVAGTGSYEVSLGTSAPGFIGQNILDPGTISTFTNHRFGSNPSEFNGIFERGRLVDNVTNQELYVRWDGSSLLTGPTGSVGVTAFGVLIPDPSASDS
jgi:hypothetical protein